jgi:polyisoprenoid-binding protein YceI
MQGFRTFVLLAAAGAAAVSPAAADTWVFDASHSGAYFSVRHMMVTNVRGSFGKIDGSVEFDGKNVAAMKVQATIDASTIDTRDPKRDEHLRSPDFFEVANHPTIEFRSKKATPAGEGKFKLVGDLTMRGVTKEVTLDVEGPTPAVQDPWGNTKVGATATTTVDRKDFGIHWNKTLDAGGVVVGDEVKITLDLQLVKKK